MAMRNYILTLFPVGESPRLWGPCFRVPVFGAPISTDRVQPHPWQISDRMGVLHESHLQARPCQKDSINTKTDTHIICISECHFFLCFSYSYPMRPGQQMLKNFNLIIPLSKTVAIVGESGGDNVPCVSMETNTQLIWLHKQRAYNEIVETLVWK